MLKRLLHGVFGAGRLPGDIRPNLETEGIDFLEEGVWGSITYLNYRAPGRWSNWRREWFLGAIVLTSRRITSYVWSQRMLDIPYDHPSLAAVGFSLDAPETFCARFDASSFHQDRSGTIELRYFTPEANRIIELLQQRRKGASTYNHHDQG